VCGESQLVFSGVESSAKNPDNQRTLNDGYSNTVKSALFKHLLLYSSCYAARPNLQSCSDLATANLPNPVMATRGRHPNPQHPQPGGGGYQNEWQGRPSYGQQSQHAPVGSPSRRKTTAGTPTQGYSPPRRRSQRRRFRSKSQGMRAYYDVYTLIRKM
jgi:hypothetical protein